MARLVAGISPDHDVQAIEAALKAHDVDVAQVVVYTKTPLEAHNESGLTFEYVVTVATPARYFSTTVVRRASTSVTPENMGSANVSCSAVEARR